MKSFSPWILTIFLLIPVLSLAQVDDIKRASSSHSSGRTSSGGGSSSDRSSSGNSFLGNFIFQMMFSGWVEWQQYKLEKKEINPTVISFDVMLQGAANPSSYYFLHPRIRGNWGLFSTDFRYNYLIEEDFDGYKHIRTNDWQVLQLNVVTTRNVIGRIGGGVIHEAFNTGETFGEWTVGVHVLSNSQHLGFVTEYRGSEPRKEWNGHVQYRVLEHGRMQGFVTGGAVFQRYYSSIDVWGMQTGFVFRVQ